MILSRRKAHFQILVFLSGTVPLIFLAGLLWRPAIPTVGESTDELFAAANFSLREDSVGIVAMETLTISQAEIIAAISKSDGGDLFLILQPSRSLQFPDLLVYWSGGDLAPETANEEAILLGQLSGRRRRQFSLTSQMQEEPGYLLFYSRGQDKAIASTPLPASLFP